MVQTVPISDFLGGRDEAVLDVRSPGEYAAGHIPGALSFPLFTDQERAEVGTLYKQEGSEPAFVRGLEIVGPKMAGFVREARRLNPRGERLRMYCFRGGQRSHSMAWLLEQAGFELDVLRGGYKAYRRHILQAFEEPQEMVVLSGCTGSGKTRLLHALALRGEQIIDLEGLACHRGSAFGGYDQPGDLTTEMFQNRLHQVWARLERNRRVWVEDEGRTLGRLLIPDEFWRQMREAPVVFADIELEHRVRLLVEEYGDRDRDSLRGSINRIARRLGGLTHRRCLEALEQGDYAQVVRYCLDYYDKAYRHCVSKRRPEPLWNLPLPGIDTEENVAILLRFVEGKVPVTAGRNP